MPESKNKIQAVAPVPQNEEQLAQEAQELHTIGEISDAVEVSMAGGASEKNFRLLEEGREYKTYLTKKFLERKPWKAPDPCQVLSHIPGSVLEIFVKVGQKVKKGEKLMIYEAMKMRNIVTSPMDGVIKEVNVKVGENLPKGALLLTFKKATNKK